MEVWRDIAGYEGYYRVSDHGNVYSVRKNLIMTKQLTIHGYHKLLLTVNQKRKDKPIHRLVASAFIPNPDNLPEVHHIDDDKLNNHVDNLQWITTADHNEITRAKHYTFVSPDGIVTEIYNLQKFARDNNLNAPNLRKVNQGKYKQSEGWTLYRGE